MFSDKILKDTCTISILRVTRPKSKDYRVTNWCNFFLWKFVFAKFFDIIIHIINAHFFPLLKAPIFKSIKNGYFFLSQSSMSRHRLHDELKRASFELTCLGRLILNGANPAVDVRILKRIGRSRCINWKDSFFFSWCR